MTMTDKDKKAAKLREQLNKAFSEQKDVAQNRILIKTADQLLKKTQWISTGIADLDAVMGGGFPRGHATSIHGSKFTGKTSLVLQTARRVLQAGGYVMYLCTENYEPEKLDFFGLYSEEFAGRFWVVEPQNYAEMMIDAAERVLWDKDSNDNRGILDMLIIDSITNFVGKKETDKHDSKGAEGQNMMVRAQLLDNFCRRLQGRGLLGHETAAVFIAQDRAHIPEFHGDPRKTKMSGGFALGYTSKIILKLKYKALPEKKLKMLGHIVEFETEKNSIIGRPGVGSYIVTYGKGVDDSKELVKLAMEYGYCKLDTRGWYRFILPNGDVLIQGKQRLAPELFALEDIKQELRDLLEKGKPQVAPIPSPGEPRMKIVIKTEDADDKTMETSEE